LFRSPPGVALNNNLSGTNSQAALASFWITGRGLPEPEPGFRKGEKWKGQVRFTSHLPESWEITGVTTYIEL
jgi:hypothetical protein